MGGGDMEILEGVVDERDEAGRKKSKTLKKK